MLRSVFSRHIVQKTRISSQFSAIRLMTVKKDDKEVATSTPLALPAAGDSESVPTTEVNSSFKLSELGPVGNVSILVSLDSIYAPMYLISRISSVFNCSYQRKWNHVPYWQLARNVRYRKSKRQPHPSETQQGSIRKTSQGTRRCCFWPSVTIQTTCGLEWRLLY